MTKTTAAALFALLLIASCSSPEYRTQHYTLLAAPDVQPVVDTAVPWRLGVGPVVLPELLDRPGIVTHTDGSKVNVAGFSIWAGDLTQAVTRVMADDLSSYLNGADVWPFPWENRVRPDMQLRMTVERFSGELGGDIVLQAKWMALSANGDEILYSTRETLKTTTQSRSYNAYVQALNTLLNDLSRRIAARLVEVTATTGRH